MASLDDLPLSVRIFLRTYRWRRIDPIPWAVPRKPLRESRVALISSAGFVTPEQEPFDPEVRGGDWSYRVVDANTPLERLLNTHRSKSFDPSGMLADPNLGFPTERMRELAAGGEIGAFHERVVSFMGSIAAPGRLMRDTAPRIAELLVHDGVDAALLVPI